MRRKRNRSSRPRLLTALARKFLHHDLRIHRLPKIRGRRQSHGPGALRQRDLPRADSAHSRSEWKSCSESQLLQAAGSNEGMQISSDGTVALARHFSDRMVKLFGEPRQPQSEITQRDMDL